ncbi:DUF5071 domain-containing protein [Mucilaginibacter sp. PAMB04168]|uniref:DUF5071 domain-containing protein n=1 Tax=Mucilaginibacter sp. PAMB04168 TaxID=3138567 RepID=UPI0031F719B2
MEYQKLIPKDKFDDSGVEKLKTLSFEEIEPIIPDLLKWLQDMNWPVAKCIADILEPFADKITSQIISILRSDDGMWKYWILGNLVRNTNDPSILMELERIARHPSKDDIDCEVNLEAVSILNGDYK